MWTRTLLKDNAKAVLRRSYWKLFLACAIAAVLTGSFDLNLDFNLGSSHHAGGGLGGLGALAASPAYGWLVGLIVTAFAAMGVLLLLLSLAFAIAWGVFFSPVVEVGHCRYMLRSRAGEQPLSVLFSGFGPSYWGLVKGMFYRNLRVFLYTLLLIIPGVVKSYQYFFVPYLLAENPALEPARAAELSTLMSEGEKWNIFVLDLSFVGWHLLGSLLLGIGDLFVLPYHEATHTELYAAMRAKAIAAGWTSEAELTAQP